MTLEIKERKLRIVVVQVSRQILFYTSYIVYNSIVGWPTIIKKNLMSCCILELWLWNISVFINLKILDLFYVFVLLLSKTYVSYILFLFLFSNHMLVLYALNPTCHIVIFSIEIFLICYTWHNYFLKICLMMCEDVFICFFSCT